MQGPLLVDGYNLLLALDEPERADEGLEGGRQRLETLLAEWSAAREVSVVLFWDGVRPRDALAREAETLRVVWIEPPAEADDGIVNEARTLVREGLTPSVLSRDRGLARRLGREVRLVAPENLVEDLAALAGPSLRAPHLGLSGASGAGDESELPASRGPVDTRRLPRRRVRRPPPEPWPDAAEPAPGRAHPHGERTAAGSSNQRPPQTRREAPDSARSGVSEELKQARRARFERAQARRQEGSGGSKRKRKRR